jgi:hypothetical protein
MAPDQSSLVFFSCQIQSEDDIGKNDSKWIINIALIQNTPDPFIFAKQVKTTFKQSTTLRISVIRLFTPFRIYSSKQPSFYPWQNTVRRHYKLIKQSEKPHLQAQKNCRELSLWNQQNCKMNETQHIIYERLFICNTSVTDQHIHKKIWAAELHTVAWATELPPSYGLPRYAKTW